MAVYKVIQDIEAEDKLVGPLTLKQFIYAAIAGVLIFINFRLFISYDLGLIRWIFMFLFSLPMILFAVLAAPLGRDQPTELWLLSHIKFMLSSRQRIWDQGGEMSSVTITAPKKTQKNLTKNLSEGEVQSRLKALASLLDSRGWAVQATPMYQQPTASRFDEGDRLIDSDSLRQSEPAVDVRVGDDLLDEQSNATAQRYGALVREVEEQKKQSIASKLSSPETAEPQQKTAWTISPVFPQPRTGGEGKIIRPDEEAFEASRRQAAERDESLDERLQAAKKALIAAHPDNSDVSPLTPLRQQRAMSRAVRVNNTKLRLVNNSNFSVATIASLANRGGESQVPF